MDVYFVRHGETVCNREHIHQPPSSPLSDLGRDQALTAGEFLRKMNVDHIITSDYVRAQETARIIGSILGIRPIDNSLFHEVRRPAKLYGKSHFHPLTIWYVLKSIFHRRDFHWWYDDAENFRDIRDRVKDALLFLMTLKKNHRSVVVVSHTIFINLLVAYMCKNRVLDLRDLLPALLHVKRLKNGEVVHIQFSEELNDCGCTWRLLEDFKEV